MEVGLQPQASPGPRRIPASLGAAGKTVDQNWRRTLREAALRSIRGAKIGELKKGNSGLEIAVKSQEGQPVLRPIARRVLFLLVAVLSVAAFEVCGAAASDSQFPFGCPVRDGYVNVSGGRVWYQVVGAGGATPLITLHGGPGFTHDYLEPLGALCKERPVIFYDQLGSGKSDRPRDKSLWRVERFVKELGEIRKELGLKRVHILGHSWGTALLTDYALTQPDGVVSLTFSDPVCSVSEFMRDAQTYLNELPPATLDTIKRHEANGYTECPEYLGACLSITSFTYVGLQYGPTGSSVRSRAITRRYTRRCRVRTSLPSPGISRIGSAPIV